MFQKLVFNIFWENYLQQVFLKLIKYHDNVITVFDLITALCA